MHASHMYIYIYMTHMYTGEELQYIPISNNSQASIPSSLSPLHAFVAGLCLVDLHFGTAVPGNKLMMF